MSKTRLQVHPPQPLVVVSLAANNTIPRPGAVVCSMSTPLQRANQICHKTLTAKTLAGVLQHFCCAGCRLCWQASQWCDARCVHHCFQQPTPHAMTSAQLPRLGAIWQWPQAYVFGHQGVSTSSHCQWKRGLIWVQTYPGSQHTPAHGESWQLSLPLSLKLVMASALQLSPPHCSYWRTV